MPTVFRDGPYRFFFYSNDGNEPPHIHVERDDCVAKYWLTPIRLQRSGGFRPSELNKIGPIIESKHAFLLRCWHEYFGF
ncbi:MAG: DUF4160 domain-containing protein [Candidatus Sumerlaeia bacterium]|nr:DUF4160 domain-containing protein [Candidatus Sumerlaeia bacterium]